jgi:hypothetical protein
MTSSVVRDGRERRGYPSIFRLLARGSLFLEIKSKPLHVLIISFFFLILLDTKQYLQRKAEYEELDQRYNPIFFLEHFSHEGLAISALKNFG